jgi:starch phosphorylase
MTTDFTLKPRLEALASNYWWSWNLEVDSIFRLIDEDLWRVVNHNPVAFLRDLPDAVRAAHETDTRLLAMVSHAEKRLSRYLATKGRWVEERAPGLGSHPVAYFSPEFCIHESLPIYSGGLGVLAGDHIKSCSDLGIPLYGVSLLYRNGYFTQQLDDAGRQTEVYHSLDVDRIAIERIRRADGSTLEVSVPTGDTTIRAAVWRVKVGLCTLLLLDVDAPEYPDLMRLYGGDRRTRILQELVLGVGGYRALCEIGAKPCVIHMNEGHSGFAALEAIAQRMEATGHDFDHAMTPVVESMVFTTHTPVEAGHDRFAPDETLRHLAPLRRRLGLTERELLAFGRIDPSNDAEEFCMSVLAIKLAARTNAVSALHGHVSRAMWRALWPERRVADVPIGHITNGVHVDTWLSFEFSRVYDECLGTDWKDAICDPARWRAIEQLDDTLLWNVKLALKHRLLDFAMRGVQDRWQRIGRTNNLPKLRPDALTIGVARRFAAYKRGDLFFSDIDKAKALLTNPERPIQIIFAGKAHPADDPGKSIVARLMQLRRDPELHDHIVLLENYDRNVSRHLLEGCDLWLNMPRRPLEACGTSGMKAVFNATLNCSTLDGWWDEAYDGTNGFAFGQAYVHSDPKRQDAHDATALYEVLEREVVPLFYERDTRGVPIRWLQRVKRALRTLGWRYNASRMVADYAEGAYLPASATATADIRR